RVGPIGQHQVVRPGPMTELPIGRYLAQVGIKSGTVAILLEGVIQRIIIPLPLIMEPQSRQEADMLRFVVTDLKVEVRWMTINQLLVDRGDDVLGSQVPADD